MLKELRQEALTRLPERLEDSNRSHHGFCSVTSGHFTQFRSWILEKNDQSTVLKSLKAPAGLNCPTILHEMKVMNCSCDLSYVSGVDR